MVFDKHAVVAFVAVEVGHTHYSHSMQEHQDVADKQENWISLMSWKTHNLQRQELMEYQANRQFATAVVVGHLPMVCHYFAPVMDLL